MFDKEYGNIRNVTVRNVTSQSDTPVWVHIYGYDENHTVEGITFENLRIGGRLILEADLNEIMLGPLKLTRTKIGPFAKDIKFLVREENEPKK